MPLEWVENDVEILFHMSTQPIRILSGRGYITLQNYCKIYVFGVINYVVEFMLAFVTVLPCVGSIFKKCEEIILSWNIYRAVVFCKCSKYGIIF